VAGTKTARQKALERAKRERMAAAEAARRRSRRRIIEIVGGAVALIGLIVLIVALATGGDDDPTDVATEATDTTTVEQTATTEPALTSVAGMPCVAMSDPVPEGAPSVPVKVGPPPTELVQEDLTPGTGAVVAPGSTVTVHYIGVSCSSGKIFDASYGGEPATFSLDGVIKGWTDGIPGMKIGGQRLLGIPSALAYGPDGRPGIAPDEALWFVVEVLDAKPA
jgi:peptidylprolyl isomerase